jgi:putative PEP-CTERM system TPR-repeat lipoprotein
MAIWGVGAAKASQGESAAAADIAEQLTVDFPDFAKGWLLKGQISLRTGELKKAATDLAVAVEKAAATPDGITEITALALLGDAQLGSRDIEGAKPTILRLASLTGAATPTRILIARLAIANEDLTLAAGELEQVLTVQPDSIPALLLMSSVHLKEKNYAQAQATLDRVLSLQPQNQAAMRMLATTQARTNRSGAALETISSLLVDDTDAELSMFASEALLSSGDSEEAIGVLERSLASNSSNTDIRMRLANAYLVAGRSAEAEAMAMSLPENVGFQRGIVLGFAIAAQGRLEESQEIIDGVVESFGEDPSVLIVAADYYDRRGEQDVSLDLLNRAVSLAPTNTAALYALGRQHLGSGDLIKAAINFEKVLAEDSDHVRALASLADVSARERDLERSIELLTAAVAIDQTAATPMLMLAKVHLLNRDTSAAEQAAIRAAQLATEDAAILVEAASVLLDIGNSREAQGYLSVAVGLQPDVSEYWYQFARAQSALGNTVESRRGLEEAVRIDATSVHAAFALMTMELNVGNTERAIEIVENLKSATPDSSVALGVEGELLTRTGQLEEAVTAYQRLYAESPSLENAVTLYRAMRSANSASPESALLDWNNSHPEDSAAALMLAQHYEGAGDLDLVVQYYESAIAADPDNVRALNNLAWILNEQGEDRAEELARRAHALSPDSSSVMDTLGWILVQKNKMAEGFQMLEAAVAAAPNSKDTRYHLAVALNKLGDTERSASTLESLLADEAPFDERAAAEALLMELRQ